mgnify:CR=1 FL=1
MKNYFGQPINPNSDIRRHDEQISYIEQRLADSIKNDDGSRCAKMEIAAYERFLARAKESRSRVAAEMFKKKGAPVEWIKNPDPLVVQPATVQIAKYPPHPNSAKLLIDFMLSEPVADLLAKEQRLPGRSNVGGLDIPLGHALQVVHGV